MNAKDNMLSLIRTVQQSTWIGPTLMTLAFLVAVLGASGCSPHPH